MITIRQEVSADIAAREALLDVCFGACRFTKTSEKLRAGQMPARGLAFVAEDRRGRIVGTLRLWHIITGDGRAALLLGPLAVDPTLQRQGLGGKLMRRAIAAVERAGHGAIILVGDAPYYSRFGFSPALTSRLWMPGPVDRARFLALELKPGALAGAFGQLCAGESGWLAHPRSTERRRAA